MTYLEIVNNVLRRMREDTVTSIASNSYSQMVGDYVNDAKELVENAWDWSALREDISITTTPGTDVYSVTGAGNRSKLLSFVNDTSNHFITYKPQVWMTNRTSLQPTLEGSPRWYTDDGVDSSGDIKIQVYPTPDAVYSLEYKAVTRQAPLSDENDEITVPAQPVIHLTIAMLARERGETGGTSTPEYFGIADKYLSDAIAFDAARHPEEMIWTTV